MLLWKSHDPSRPRTISPASVSVRERIERKREGAQEQAPPSREGERERRGRPSWWVGCSRELKGQECLTAIFQWSHRVSYRRRDLSPHPWPLWHPAQRPNLNKPPSSFPFLPPFSQWTDKLSLIFPSSRASNAFPGVRRLSSLPLLFERISFTPRSLSISS